jgi:hypothetical protein
MDAVKLVRRTGEWHIWLNCQGRFAMRRKVLIASGLMAMIAVSAPAYSQNYPHYGVGMTPTYSRGYASNIEYGPNIPPSPDDIDPRQVSQILRWGSVGRCVAAANPEASLAYVTARPRSPAALAAARTLDSAFSSCFAGTHVIAERNVAIRRAAVADALGVKLQ